MVTYMRSFHWILLFIELDKSKIVIMDSLQKGPEKVKPLIDLLNR